MEKTIKLKTGDICPDRTSVLERMGVNKTAELHHRLEETLDHAYRFFRQLAKPVGKLRNVSIEQFGIIYRGEGLNTDHTPVFDVVPRADFLALFVVTLGDIVSTTINDLFDCNEPHLGFALDAVCSQGAEAAAEKLESIFRGDAEKNRKSVPGNSSTPLFSRRFSPGYCGWHLSSQIKLLDSLRAQEIGIFLTDTYLMGPLKSVSGVMAAGPEHIFTIENPYPVCDQCRETVCHNGVR